MATLPSETLQGRKAEFNLYRAFNELLSTLVTVLRQDNLRVFINNLTQITGLVQFIECTKKLFLRNKAVGAKSSTRQQNY